MELSRIPRRRRPRLRLGVQALFIGIGGQEKIVLQDLSRTGAKVLRRSKEPISKGVLRRLGFETFGEVVWQRGPWIGLEFDVQLDEAILLETRAAAPTLLEEAAKETENFARDFVLGRRKAR